MIKYLLSELSKKNNGHFTSTFIKLHNHYFQIIFLYFYRPLASQNSEKKHFLIVPTTIPRTPETKLTRRIAALAEGRRPGVHPAGLGAGLARRPGRPQTPVPLVAAVAAAGLGAVAVARRRRAVGRRGATPVPVQHRRGPLRAGLAAARQAVLLQDGATAVGAATARTRVLLGGFSGALLRTLVACDIYIEID